MRWYQHVGLTPEAEQYIKDNAVTEPDLKCPYCMATVTTKLKVVNVEHEDKFYGDGPNLRTFEHKNGGTFKEKVQADPWSSGLMGFICLERNLELICKWTDK